MSCLIKKYKKISVPNVIYKNIIDDKVSPISFVTLYISLIQNSIFKKEELIHLINKYNIPLLSEVIINFSGSHNYGHPAILQHDDVLREKTNHYLKLFSNFNSSVEQLFDEEITPSTTFYNDTVRMLDIRNQSLKSFFKIKKWNDIVTLHDELYTLINLEKIEKFNEGIREFSEKYHKIKSSEINNITFNLIDDVVSLEKESKIMNHCVKSYAESLSRGRHLLFSVVDKTTGDRATLDFYNLKSNSFASFHEIAEQQGVEIKDSWNFSQLKAKYNRKTTKRIVDTLSVFCKEVLDKNNITYRLDVNNYDLTLNPNKTNYGEIDYPNAAVAAGAHVHNDINHIINEHNNGLDDDLPF